MTDKSIPVKSKLPPPLIAVRTDPGHQHPTNQDAVAVQLPSDKVPSAFFAVADGVSTLPNSELASQLAVEVTRRTLYAQKGAVQRETAPIAIDDPDPTLGREAGIVLTQGTRSKLIDALNEANNAIRAQAEKDHVVVMGTTIAGLLIGADQTALVFNVGDSHVYRLRGASFDLLSRDQIVPLPDRKSSDPDVPQKKRSTQLAMYLGQPDRLRPFVEESAVKRGDVFLICTDGLWSLAEPSELRQVLVQKTPAEAADHLLKLAMERGAPDNVSLIVISYRPPPRRNSLRAIAAVLAVMVIVALYFVISDASRSRTIAPYQNTSATAPIAATTIVPTVTASPSPLATAGNNNVVLPTAGTPGFALDVP